MSVPRKHHYLPEFYTKAWLGPNGQMVRYTRVHSGRIDRRWVTPGGVGFERDLYTMSFTDNEALVQSLELGTFAYLDNYGARVFAQLAAGEIPDDDRDRTVFAAFMFSLQRRTPHAIEKATDEIQAELEQKFGQLNLPRYREGLRHAALVRLFGLPDASPAGRAVINMDWSLIEAPSDASLMTSECPVLLFGDGDTFTGHVAMPVSKIESFAMPVSPRYLIVGRWTARGPTGLQTMSPRAAAKTFNKYVVQSAVSLVIAQDDCHDAFVRKHFGSRAGA